jgi:hypothetical protein
VKPPALESSTRGLRSSIGAGGSVANLIWMLTCLRGPSFFNRWSHTCSSRSPRRWQADMVLWPPVEVDIDDAAIGFMRSSALQGSRRTTNIQATRVIWGNPGSYKDGIGKFDMKLFGSRLFGQAIKAAGVGAALMLSVSVIHAQSGPFTGFNGSWSGNGTVALSDGTTERIRCKASYNVNGAGLGLKQTLRCASDSYKFDLSTDITSQGDRIYGNWSEASRNIFGNLQGTAGGGQIEVFVEASGFAASVTLRTTGSRQTVQISSKGEIRSVNITMSKGG